MKTVNKIWFSCVTVRPDWALYINRIAMRVYLASAALISTGYFVKCEAFVGAGLLRQAKYLFGNDIAHNLIGTAG